MCSSTDHQPFCLWPTKSPGAPAPLKVRCLSVCCGQQEMCVCMFVCMCPSNLSKTSSLHSFCFCVASPASRTAAAPAPLAHLAALAPGSWFQWPAQERAHPGGMPPTQRVPPTSSWQQWQDSLETLLLTSMSGCTLGMTVV